MRFYFAMLAFFKVLNAATKVKKVENLIMELRKLNKIINKGTRKNSSWELLS